MKTLQSGNMKGFIAMTVLRSGILITPLWVGFLLILVLWLFGVIQPFGTFQAVFGS